MDCSKIAFFFSTTRKLFPYVPIQQSSGLRSLPPMQVLDQRVTVHGGAGGAGVHVDGAQSSVPVQHRPSAVGQAASRPVAPVQQHAVPDVVAGVQSHAVATAVARPPLSTHAFPAAQTTPLGMDLRSRVGHHVVVSSNHYIIKIRKFLKRRC